MWEVARYVVSGSWAMMAALWLALWIRARKGRSEGGRKTNPIARLGMILHLAPLFLILWFRSQEPAWPDWIYALSALLAVAAAVFGWAAARHLGAQLRIQAVVTEKHTLITTGPYSIVRHPIYTCVTALILALGIAFASPAVLALTLPLVIAGTEIRVRAEDNLLAGHFGAEFEHYRRRVRSWLPAIR